MHQNHRPKPDPPPLRKWLLVIVDDMNKISQLTSFVKEHAFNYEMLTSH